MTAEVPPLRERPLLTMADMAMDHGNMGGMDHGSMDHASMDHASMDHASMDHGAMDHGGMGGGVQAHDHKKGAGVDMLAMAPKNRLAERGMGLEAEPHRVLVYAELESLEANPDRRAPEREIELHLTGNMERFMWSFDGEKFSDVDEPIVFNEGERVRLTLVNDTMMQHPIHLHGMFFDVVTHDSERKPRKHTINVKPGEKLSLDITADAVGDWAFHCHLLYHMMAGMMRTVSVRPAKAGADPHQHHKAAPAETKPATEHDHQGHGQPAEEKKPEAPAHEHHDHGGGR
jgi:FtsP/CotA-like multicopper oxidase with cupredoxin domain